MRELKRRVKKLEQKGPQGMPPLIVTENISPEEVKRLERESIQKYGAPCLIITLKRPELSTLRGNSD
jgi:hypothetical protein